MSDTTLAVPARAELPRGWFDSLTAYLPEAYRPKAVIAGGFAVRQQDATDIDLWIPAGGDYLQTYCDIKNHLVAAGHIPTPAALQEWVLEEVYPDGRHLVATIKNALLGKDLQILVAEAPDAQALVDSFDLSVHALGLSKKDNENFLVHFGKDWTPASEPIKVLRFTTPQSTLDRLYKLAARYGLTWDHEQEGELVRKLPTEREEAA